MKLIPWLKKTQKTKIYMYANFLVLWKTTFMQIFFEITSFPRAYYLWPSELCWASQWAQSLGAGSTKNSACAGPTIFESTKCRF